MKTFEWCGYNWKCEMSGGRIIHPEHPWYWYSLDTIRTDKTGTLELFLKRNPRDITHWNGVTYHPIYEVSTMRSVEEFGYGTFSCEMMMPLGKNITASFWLTGSGNWPPEIDVEEGIPEDKQKWFRMFEKYPPYIKPGWRTTTNVHYRDELMNKTHVGTRNIPWIKQRKDPSENFIEYKCKWEPDKITFYADGKVVRTICGDVCKKMTKNITDPEKGFKMNVVFNTWCRDPNLYRIDMITPMLIRNFKYEPL